MFTGLIQDIGTIRSIDKKGDWTLMIETTLDLNTVKTGASIACSGICLTAIEIGKAEKGPYWFLVEVSSETISKTNIKNWSEGQSINLEPSLKMGDELGGHFVFGHVDGLAVLEDIKQDGDSHRLTIKPPGELMPYIAPKGSVSLDGISLTVNEVGTETFGVNIVPHTWDNTTIGKNAKGDQLNIEIDMLARYVARQMPFGQSEAA
ncbi:MAG: riboflavin synthase [Pseudomonadota bacterium]